MILTETYFALTSCKKALTKNGNSYLTLTVKNDKGTFNVNVWNASKIIEPSKAVTFSEIQEKDGFYSCKLSSVVVESIELHPLLMKFLPVVISKESWLHLGKRLSSLCEDEKESNFILSSFQQLYPKYSTSTAARSNHHAFIGGLLNHTYEILNMFSGLYPNYLPFSVNPFVVIISCLYHDFGKIFEYTNTLDYKPEFFLKGHPFMGAEAVGIILRKENFPPNIITSIQHCILSHHGKLEYGSPVLPANQEAFLVAKLDELSGIGVQYSNADNGSRAMSTQIYHV